MIISTPVNCSMVLIFLPSRPIIRPFISSLGRSTIDEVLSWAWEEAHLSITVERICLDFLSNSSEASASILLRRRTKLSAIDFSTLSINIFSASLLVRAAIFSNLANCSSLILEISSFNLLILSVLSANSCFLFSKSINFWSKSDSRFSNLFLATSKSWRSRLASFLASSKISMDFSWPLSKISFCFDLASIINFSIFSSTVPWRFLAHCLRAI